MKRKGKEKRRNAVKRRGSKGREGKGRDRREKRDQSLRGWKSVSVERQVTYRKPETTRRSSFPLPVISSAMTIGATKPEPSPTSIISVQAEIPSVRYRWPVPAREMM